MRIGGESLVRLNKTMYSRCRMVVQDPLRSGPGLLGNGNLRLNGKI
jgi:hypothetical protein